MRVTVNNINKAIKAKTGKDIKLYRDTNYAYCFIYSDDDAIGLELSKLPGTSLNIWRLCHVCRLMSG